MLYIVLGIVAGGSIAVQSVLNASLGKRVGPFGAVLILTVVSICLLLLVIVVFPNTASLRRAPAPSEWYLYLGGVLGIVILAAPVILVPALGATSTVTAMIVGQLIMAVVLDEIGILGIPRIPVDANRLAGVVLLIAGTFLVRR